MRKSYAFGIVIVLIVLVAGGCLLRPHQPKPSLYIVVAGPMQQPNERTMLNAVKLYLQQHPIDGKQIEVIPVDDENNGDLAYQRAQEIVQAIQALLVIGHRVSNASLKAGATAPTASGPTLKPRSTFALIRSMSKNSRSFSATAI